MRAMKHSEPRELPADDFEPGLYFTVLDSDPVNGKSMFTGEDIPIGKYMGAFRGEVLRMEAINLPFLAFRVLSSAEHGDRVFEMDTKKVRLMKLNADYVAARRVRRPWWKFWKWGN